MEDPSASSIVNPRAHLYKFKENKSSQHERRIKFLEEQKEKRHQLADENRDLCDLFIKEIEESVDDDYMEYEVSNNDRKPFQYKLMLTEWFTDIPDDLEENWLVKFAPEGFRILLITRNRNARIYNKKGKILFRIKTNFPGTTILDCIYNKRYQTFFILDCLYWNAMSLLGNDSVFRFYWLKTKFEENTEIYQCLNNKFILMDCFPAEKTLIHDKIFDIFKLEDHDILYDGLVFYHKECEYTLGYTPLATWLASYMLPEKLGIDVPNIYLKKQPDNYINLQHYIDNQDLFIRAKKQNRKKKDLEQMEV